jgi:hypothetical protein
MIELHPKIIKRRGHQFAVLPYEEFLALQAAVAQMSELPLPAKPQATQGSHPGKAVASPSSPTVLLEQGWTYSFKENLSAEDYAKRQGGPKIRCAHELYGEGDPEDWKGFDEALERWRALPHDLGTENAG